MNIYDIPLYYISFDKNINLENHFKNNGFTNVNHFKAINGKKFKPSDLKNNNIITIRSFNDLVNGREQHSGLSGLGCIGCTMSHYLLWKKCIENNLPYIIIAENDVYLPNKFTKQDLDFISNTLSKPKSGFFATKKSTNNNIIKMTGLQFYILSNSACKELIKETFPIDVQTDHYISNLADRNKINIDAKPISKQKIHLSSVQTSTCVKCDLPTNITFYISIGLGILLLCIASIFIYKKYKSCVKSCKV